VYLSQDWSAPVYTVLSSGVPSQKNPSLSNGIAVPEEGVTVTLGIGETKYFKDLSVKLVSIDQDSRCPEDVLCVWAGEVVLTLLVTLPSGNVNTVILKTDGVPRIAGYYEISIFQIKPSKMVKIKTAENYRVTISVKPVHWQ
jgi:hypothetical protein